MIRREQDANWEPLGSVASFADAFQTPPILPGAATTSQPRVVRLFAFGFFAAAGISAVFMASSLVGLMHVFSTGSFHPNATFYAGWSISLLGLPIRVISGVGLLRQKEWARRLAVIYGAIAAILGCLGLVQTIAVLGRTADLRFILTSPTFVLGHLWSIILLVFNVSTVIVLNRSSIRAAFIAGRGGA